MKKNKPTARKDDRRNDSFMDWPGLAASALVAQAITVANATKVIHKLEMLKSSTGVRVPIIKMMLVSRELENTLMPMAMKAIRRIFSFIYISTTDSEAERVAPVRQMRLSESV